MASCSVVEFGPDEVERAVQVALPRDWPRSAVAAEMFSIAVALAIIARGQPDEFPHLAGSIGLVVDCEAVVEVAARRDGYMLSEKSRSAGCWEGFPGGLIGKVDKAAAHVGEQVAAREGWHKEWKGNDTADVLAEDARPHVGGCPINGWRAAAAGEPTWPSAARRYGRKA